MMMTLTTTTMMMTILLSLSLFLFLFLLTMSPPVEGLQFRIPTNDDILIARQILLKEKMNPLSITKERLLIAYDETNIEKKPLLGFGQIRPLDEDDDDDDGVTYSELASLYVLPDYRKQGIGGRIVQTLLDRHYGNMNEDDIEISADDVDTTTKKERKDNDTNKICLLTLRPTVSFYEPYGFRIATDVERKLLPSTIQMEYMAGNALSFILGNDLICMIN